MHYRRRLLPLIISLLVAMGTPLLCCAQSAPQPLPISMVGSAELAPEQMRQITEYVAYFAGQLNTASGPAEVESARAALIAPLNQPNAARLVSPVFRLEYSNAVTPEMRKALSGSDLHRSVNALLVLSQLGESRAADLVLEQTAANRSWQVRLQAASALRVLLQGGALDAKKAPIVARRVGDAAAREENGLVLAHLLAAIDAAIDNVPRADQAEVRGFLVDAMVAVGDRIARRNEFAGPMVDAFAKELERFRPRYALAPDAAQGKKLAPALVNILAHIGTHWDTARADPAKVERLVGACETSLHFINGYLKGPTLSEVNLRTDWTRGNKAKFDEGVKAWQDLLKHTAYK